MTLADLLSAAGPAFVDADTGATTTFEQLGAEVEELAGRLAASGVGRGDRVALVHPDGPRFVRLLLAFYLDDLRPKVLLLPPGELPAAREASGVPVLDELPERTAPFERAQPDDVA